MEQKRNEYDNGRQRSSGKSEIKFRRENLEKRIKAGGKRGKEEEYRETSTKKEQIKGETRGKKQWKRGSGK